MTDLNDPATVVQACVGCHVGAPPAGKEPARDVNHDLLAAGHPPLRFELSSYLAYLPAHWNEAARRRCRGEDFAARAWSIGQAASARAALELLAYRARQARKANPGSRPPWPEFAEYSCAGCHHDLSAARVHPGPLPSRAGWWSWSAWHTAMPRAFGPGPAPAAGPALAALDEVERLMNVPVPASSAVEKKAEEAARLLADWQKDLARARWDADELRQTLSRLSGVGRAPELKTWDGAAQLYLALEALADAYLTVADSSAGGRTGRDREVRRALDSLARLLEFPPGREGPGYPRTPAGTAAEMEKVLDRLGRPFGP
jgi:hypothetical protein